MWTLSKPRPPLKHRLGPSPKQCEDSAVNRLKKAYTLDQGQVPANVFRREEKYKVGGSAWSL